MLVRHHVVPKIWWEVGILGPVQKGQTSVPYREVSAAASSCLQVHLEHDEVACLVEGPHLLVNETSKDSPWCQITVAASGRHMPWLLGAPQLSSQAPGGTAPVTAAEASRDRQHQSGRPGCPPGATHWWQSWGHSLTLCSVGIKPEKALETP